MVLPVAFLYYLEHNHNIYVNKNKNGSLWAVISFTKLSMQRHATLMVQVAG